MMDQYSRNRGCTIPAMSTGKPLPLGGSLGRTEATARGRGGALAGHLLDPKLGPAGAPQVIPLCHKQRGISLVAFVASTPARAVTDLPSASTHLSTSPR